VQQGAYAPGDVAARSSNGQNVEGTADKKSVKAQMSVQGKGNYNVGRKGNAETAEGKGAGGKTFVIDQSKKNPDNGVRTADTQKYHGEIDNKKSGNDQNWNSKVSTGQNMDTVMHGKGDSFDATGSKGHKYNVDPDPGQSKAGGKGTMTMDGTKRNYQESQTGSESQAQLSNVNGRTYTCQGAKGTGVSNCVDDQGNKQYEVVEQSSGDVLVKKQIAKGVVAPIGKAHVTKADAQGKSSADISDGMFTAQAGNYKERDCMSDYGKSPSKVVISKPCTMKWNSESKDGRRVFQAPDCITYGCKITLPPGMDIGRLAVQFDLNLLPAGKLKCVDSGSCNKDCYYCNLCNNTRKNQIMANADNSNLCKAKGGGTYQIEITACPPPESLDKAQCSGFTKLDESYWKKKGDVQARMIFTERSPNEQATRDNYYNNINSNPTAKMLLKTQFTIANKNFINANNPTDFDLAEFYVKKNAKPAEEVVACVEGTDNYTIGGSKAGGATKLLLEGGSIAAAPKSLFDSKPCPAVDQINQAEAQQEAADSKTRAKPSAWGNFGSFFGGKRRRRDAELENENVDTGAEIDV